MVCIYRDNRLTGLENHQIVLFWSYLKLLRHHIERCLIHKTSGANKKFKEISGKNKENLKMNAKIYFSFISLMLHLFLSEEKERQRQRERKYELFGSLLQVFPDRGEYPQLGLSSSVDPNKVQCLINPNVHWSKKKSSDRGDFCLIC